MKRIFLLILTLFLSVVSPEINFGQAPNLRSTVGFALFTAGGDFDNTGSSSIKGDIGSKTYTTTGFPPGTISGNIYNASHTQSTQAATDVVLLYDDLTRTPLDIIAVSLGGQTLTAGVHSTGSGGAAILNGNITLDGQGNPDALFIIRIDGALSVGGSSNVLLINSASPNNVFWQINGAFSLGISSVFRGIIVSGGGISLLGNSTLIGKGLTKAGAIALSTSTVITKLNPDAPTITVTQPSCSLATGTITITAPVTAGTSYSMDGINYANTTGIFSAVTPGTYQVTDKDVDGFISARTAVTINAQPATPAAPIVGAITQPTCTVATGSVVLSGLPAGNWTLNPGAISGSSSSTTVSNIGAGTHTYTVTNAAGCTSTASSNVIINTQPAIPSAPIIGTIVQPTCTVATGSVVVSGLPAGNWTLNPGAISGSSSSTTVSALLAGTYAFTVTNAAGCTSVASSNVVINTQPVTPAAPIAGAITQPSCIAASGTVELSGLPAGNWTLNPGAISGNTSTIQIDTLDVGTYQFTVTNAAGCTSVASTAILINASSSTPAKPIIGTITQPTCIVNTGSVVLSGLPAGNWTINPGAISGSSSSTIISNLAPGTYQYTVTNADGCISKASAKIIINTQPVIPTAPIVGVITQPTCLVATASFLLSGLPAGNWTLNPGANSGNTTSVRIDTLDAGTYQFTVTNAAGCTSPASAAVVINAFSSTPVKPIVGTILQPSCTVATGSVLLTGLPAGNWTLNPGAVTGNGTSTTISNLVAGTYQYTVTNADGCTSKASSSIIINTQPLTPTAPTIGAITQPTCLVATGIVQLGNLPAGNWTLNPGAIIGNTTSIPIDTLDAGTYRFTVTNAAGCTSAPSADIVINAFPATPVKPIVGIITQPTCTVATGTVVLSGLPAGNWTLNPGAISGNGSNTTVSNLSAGIYFFTATNSDGCTSRATSIITIQKQPLLPDALAGANREICQNTSTQIGTTAKPGNTYQWSSVPAGYFSDLANPLVTPNSTTTYTLIETSTASGCFNSHAVLVTVKIVPAAAGTITGMNPVCTGQKGVIYTVNEIIGATGYLWTLPPGASITAGANTNRITVSYNATAVSGNLIVQGTNSCGNGNLSAALAIAVNICTIADLSVKTTASNMAPFMGRTIILTVNATNEGPYDATGVTVSNLLQSGYTYQSASSGNYDPVTGVWTIGNLKNGLSNQLTILVKVNPAGIYLHTATIAGNEPDDDMTNNVSSVKPIPTDFFLPEGFSPNGDHINDLFVIRGIQYFPDNHFTIFNRWGNKVYETTQYKNTWSGKSTMGLRIGGDDLPTGTYFYLLDLGDGSAIIKGTIYLNR